MKNIELIFKFHLIVVFLISGKALEAQNFNPFTDPSLILRLDDQSPFYKDSAGTQPCTNGDSCGYWGDLSGKGHNAYAVKGANKPVYVANALNGKAGLKWTYAGASQRLSLGRPQQLYHLQNTKNFSFLIIATSNMVTHSGFLLSEGNGNSCIFNVFFNNNAPETYYPSSVGIPVTGNGFFTYGVTCVDTISGFSQGISRFYQDGSCRGSSEAIDVDTTDNIAIGDMSDGSVYYSFNGTIFALYIYNRTLSPSEMFQADQFLRNRYSQIWPGDASGKMIIWDGNSISMNDAIVAEVANLLNIPPAAIFNIAWGGKDYIEMNTYHNDVDSIVPYLPKGKQLISVGWEWTNELMEDGMNPSAAYQDMITYCKNVKAMGMQFVTGTCLPRCNNAGFETAREEVNDSLRADHTNIEALADCGADSIMGNANNACNTALYGDGLHPTPHGDTIISPYFANAIKSLPVTNPTLIPEKTSADGMISIYPNPAKDKITIEISDGNSVNNIEIFDISGKLILSQTILMKNNFGISSLEPGIYIIKVSGNSGVFIGKVIKD